MSRARRAALLGAIALAGLVASSAAARAGGFVGDWARSESRRAADRAALESEIERATASMSILTRGLSRAFLRRQIEPTERYRIAQQAGGVLLIRDVGTEWSWRVDGEPERREDGEVTGRLEAPDRIRQEWRRGDTHGVTEWNLAPSGEALVVAVTAHHPRLPAPLRYRTHYERVQAPRAPR